MSQDAAPRSSSRSAASRDSPSAAPLPGQALADLWEHGSDVQRLVRRLLALRLDQEKLRLRRALVGAAAGVLALCVVLAALCLGVWHLLRGLAGAVAALAPEHPWLGDAAAGLLPLTAIAGGAAVVWWSWNRAGLRKARAKYGPERFEAEPGVGGPPELAQAKGWTP